MFTTAKDSNDYNDDAAGDAANAGGSKRWHLRDPRQLGLHGVRGGTKRVEDTASSLDSQACRQRQCAAAQRTVHVKPMTDKTISYTTHSNAP